MTRSGRALGWGRVIPGVSGESVSVCLVVWLGVLVCLCWSERCGLDRLRRFVCSCRRVLWFVVVVAWSAGWCGVVVVVVAVAWLCVRVRAAGGLSAVRVCADLGVGCRALG